MTNTPDVLTNDVANVAIGLALVTLRKICWYNRFVRSGLWRDGDFQLGLKVFAQGSSQGLFFIQQALIGLLAFLQKNPGYASGLHSQMPYLIYVGSRYLLTSAWLFNFAQEVMTV
ncbi:hypothetical protein RHMOL_Rhmol09G0273300 [Rhododendron molle]|uniref:Uncharacterized protein n=1 Tax=Rhododendron molle TaxID=49168 RepID=A0ACC0MI45_RHOML|nr:hypothetical protein RHMOL_Rhmol09G0273300 [Rhododendron molle]